MIENILGGVASDDRGEIRFVNDFDMTAVKRFYIIKNADIETIRGWRAHKMEQRWFYVLSGSFTIDLVLIDDWNQPSQSLPVRRESLEVYSSKVLHVGSGYATAIQASEPDSVLLVFADYGIENASYDDYVYPVDYFENRKID